MDDGFFAVGLNEWRQACELGLTEACSLIVLACGTGRDNSTTSWSANAVQNYAGVSWIRAKPAIDRLGGAGLLQNVGKTSKPRYKLKISEERIWLPKSIVMPLRGEMPVLHRVRQVQDVMLLRLFVELYFAQNLAADGGLSRKVYYEKYSRENYAESGEYIFYGYDRLSCYVCWDTDVTRVHRDTVSKAEEKEGKNPGHAFFKRIGTLIEMGLLEYSVCLFESESEDAEILFPITGPIEVENTMESVAYSVSEKLLQDWQLQNNPHKYLIPVLRHQEKAQAYGVYRLRHRPHTDLTAAWWAQMHNRVEQAKSSYLR